MIIVDTSIWIEFFRKRPPYFEHLIFLLEQRKVCTPELIFAELLQGAKNEREINKIYSYWKNLPSLASEEFILKAGEQSAREKWHNKGASLIDSIIITYGKETGYPIWTLDKKVQKVLKREERYDPKIIT